LNKQNTLVFLLLSALLLGGYAFLPARRAPVMVAAPAPVPERTLTLENPELQITWRTRDAAIVQVAWREDGTRLLPEPCLGLGAATSGRFTGLPQVVRNPGGQDLTFRGEGGERSEWGEGTYAR